MNVNHCHLSIGMLKNFFKNWYVNTIHHKVAGECMGKDVCTLAFR